MPPLGNDPALRIVQGAANHLGLWGKLRDGRASDGEKRNVVLRIVDGARTSARWLGGKLVAGAVGARDFTRKLAGLIVPRHEAAGLVLLPDPTRPLVLTPADHAILDPRKAEQLAYLERFHRGLATGEVPIDGRIVTRAELYARAIWGVGVNALRDKILGRVADGGLADDYQINEERRVLGHSEHCPECPDLAAEGWQVLGSLPDIGDTICMAFCHCSFEYRHRPGAGRAVVAPRPKPAPKPAQVPVKVPVKVPVPALKPFGPSAAKVTLSDPQALKRAARILGRTATKQDLASLVGATDTATVDVTSEFDRVTVTTRYRDAAGAALGSSTREIKETGGRPYIRNVLFEVNATAQGQGLGTAVLGRQIEQAPALGITAIRAEAARDDVTGMVGYKVWPRMGFDAPIPPAVAAQLPAGLTTAASLSDLMRTPAGRSFWDAHGVAVNVTFDLTPGSTSRRVWDAYRAAKGP